LLERGGHFAQLLVVGHDVLDFLLPAGHVHGEELFEVTFRQIEAGKVQRVGCGQIANGGFRGLAFAFHPFANPLQHAAVLAVAGPQPLAVETIASIPAST